MPDPIVLNNSRHHLLHVIISTYPLKENLTLERIKNFVVTFFDVQENSFISASRKHEAVVARTFYAVLCRKLLPDASLKNIGYQMRRDHSTTISCIKRFQNYIEQDQKFKKYFANIRAMILREEIPYPDQAKYVPERPIAEIVNEMKVREMKFNIDDDVEEETVKHYADNNGYSYRSKAL